MLFILMNDEGLIVCKSVFKSFYALSFFFGRGVGSIHLEVFLFCWCRCISCSIFVSYVYSEMGFRTMVIF